MLGRGHASPLSVYGGPPVISAIVSDNRRVSSIRRFSVVTPETRLTTHDKVVWSPLNFQTGRPRNNRYRIAKHADHRREDPAALPPLLWWFGHP